jgi:hypothetical protein
VPDPGDLATIEAKMARVVQSMERDFGHLKMAAASASLLDDIHVDHGGRRARLIEVASVTVPDPRQIVIQPWDPGSLRTIGTAISQSRIGLTPTIDGPAIRLDVPAMTEDRRREIVGLVHKWMDRPGSRSGPSGTGRWPSCAAWSEGDRSGRTKPGGGRRNSSSSRIDSSPKSIASAASRKRVSCTSSCPWIRVDTCSVKHVASTAIDINGR